MIRLRAAILFSFFLLTGLFMMADPIIEKKELPVHYEQWLEEEVVYIITQREKEVFLQLDSNQERDLFIEAFWKQRDPTPETSRNEFKDEHYRRIEYANTRLGRGSSQPGWKTDRGRIYIILGKPATSESYGALEHNLVPLEVWFYQGSFGPGIPASFYMVFFKESGIGDYILYSPIRHGPQKLLETFDVNPDKALNILRQVNPELANVARSLIPSQTAHLDARTALPSEVLLNNINVLPQKRIDDDYAEKLLKYRSLIEVDHSVLYVENDALFKVIQDEAGFFIVHYAVEPGRLSIEKYGDKYSAHLEVFGKISDLEGKTIHQFQREVSLDFDEDQVAAMRSKLFSFQDSFPLIPGDFHFDLLIKNTVSKEFTSVERDIRIPQSADLPELSPIILSRTIENIVASEKTHRPFRLGRIGTSPSAKNAYAPGDDLYACFKLYGALEELEQNGFLEFIILKEEQQVHVSRKNLKDNDNSEPFLQVFSLADFSPGYYLLKVLLRDENQKEIGQSSERFVIIPMASPPEYWCVSEVYPQSDDPYYAFTLGRQMYSQGEMEKAVLLLEMAYSQRPASFEFSVALADTYYALGEYLKVQELMSRFLEKAKDEPAVFRLLGRSCYEVQDYGKAIYYFKKYLSQFGTHIGLLNVLGDCYAETGNLDEALAAWERSLELDTNQDEIRAKIVSLKEKK
ncbi:GWxTD domain-containing protein [Acidobacteriota bacterium]